MLPSAPGHVGAALGVPLVVVVPVDMVELPVVDVTPEELEELDELDELGVLEGGVFVGLEEVLALEDVESPDPVEEVDTELVVPDVTVVDGGEDVLETPELEDIELDELDELDAVETDVLVLEEPDPPATSSRKMLVP